ncbi:MAG: DUF6933 domain-containing protein [Eubacteriales bacterium]
MILYVTKQTLEYYQLKMPEDFIDPVAGSIARTVLEREGGDRLLEWCGKLFMFEDTNCLLVSNFASKLSIVLVDVKMEDRPYIGNMIAHYLLKLYEENRKMTILLKRQFDENPLTCFALLKDRSAISTLNHTQSDYLLNGYRLVDYIRDGILRTVELQHDINRKWLFSQKINGKTEYFYPADRFEQLLCERYHC